MRPPIQAEKVMETLRGLADSGHTVICTIHQPRGSIFKMFDDLMLLSAGRLVYHGAAADAVGCFKVCPLLSFDFLLRQIRLEA